MIVSQSYQYELWDGKQVVGRLTLPYKLVGISIRLVFSPGPLKEVYGKKYESITCPVVHHVIHEDGIDTTIRCRVDVRRKSKRQIALLSEYRSYW